MKRQKYSPCLEELVERLLDGKEDTLIEKIQSSLPLSSCTTEQQLLSLASLLQKRQAFLAVSSTIVQNLCLNILVRVLRHSNMSQHALQSVYNSVIDSHNEWKRMKTLVLNIFESNSNSHSLANSMHSMSNSLNIPPNPTIPFLHSMLSSLLNTCFTLSSHSLSQIQPIFTDISSPTSIRCLCLRLVCQSMNEIDYFLNDQLITLWSCALSDVDSRIVICALKYMNLGKDHEYACKVFEQLFSKVSFSSSVHIDTSGTIVRSIPVITSPTTTTTTTTEPNEHADLDFDIGGFVHVLEHDQKHVRIAAIRCIRQQALLLDSPRLSSLACKFLIDLFTDRSPLVQTAALSAVTQLGQESVPLQSLRIVQSLLSSLHDDLVDSAVCLLCQTNLYDFTLLFSILCSLLALLLQGKDVETNICILLRNNQVCLEEMMIHADSEMIRQLPNALEYLVAMAFDKDRPSKIRLLYRLQTARNNVKLNV